MTRGHGPDCPQDVREKSTGRPGVDIEREKNKGLSSSVSVRSGLHPREHDQLTAATITLVALRPDWRHDTTRDALAADPRPWRTVIAAALACALDPQAHPALIATTRPERYTADAGPTPTPPSIADYRNAPRCPHGAHEGACALCRRHLPADPEDAAWIAFAGLCILAGVFVFGKAVIWLFL